MYSISGISFFNVSTSLNLILQFLSILNPLYGMLVLCVQINKLFAEILSNRCSNPLSTPLAAPERTMYRNIPQRTPIIVIIVRSLFCPIEPKISCQVSLSKIVFIYLSLRAIIGFILAAFLAGK